MLKKQSSLGPGTKMIKRMRETRTLEVKANASQSQRVGKRTKGGIRTRRQRRRGKLQATHHPHHPHPHPHLPAAMRTDAFCGTGLLCYFLINLSLDTMDVCI